MTNEGGAAPIEAVYTERNQTVAALVALAQRLGYPTYAYSGGDPEWPVIFIDLPSGQVSWHVPLHEFALYFPALPRSTNNPWDGHNNQQKAARLIAEAGGASGV